jgi:protein involved in ribonucleotide reduction
MLVVFDTRTGNVERFVDKTGLPYIKIGKGLVVHEPFVLVTYTTGFGRVAVSTGEFLESNHTFMRGVASSGNRNWGNNYCKAADLIADRYGVPIILKFELSGSDVDVEKFTLGVRSIEVYRA